MAELVRRSTPAPGVVQLTLSRPERLNAMTAGLVDDLHHALDDLDDDERCRVVLLTGEGRAFCAGLDLGGYGRVTRGAPGGSETERAMVTQRHISSLIPRLRSLRQPVIAAVNGPAVGGGLALVLGSDLRIAARSARFGAAFITIGVSGCDIGTSWLLPRIVGAGRAHELMLTGRVIDAAEAAAIGLVLDVVDDDQLLEVCLAKAAAIQANGPYAVAMTKETMWASLEVSGLEAAIALENRTQVMCLGSGEHLEAVDAFLSKRPARWAPGG